MVAVLSAALLSGCGSDSPASTAPASALAMCQGVGTAFVAKVSACGMVGLPLSILEALLALELDCQSFQEAQAAGRVAFDPATAKACLDTINGSTCSALFTESGFLPAPCFNAVAPRVAAGGACYNRLGIECVAGFCDFTATTACTTGGTCVTSATLGQNCTSPMRCAPGLICGATNFCETRPTTIILAAGGNCGALYTACADGLFCDSSVTPRLCAARKIVGAACTSSNNCAASLRCDPVTSLCATQARVGEACVPARLACAGEAYCSAANTCVASPGLGEVCTPVAGEMVFCQDSWCLPSTPSAVTRRCAPYAAPGAACSTSNQLQCGFGYNCNAVGAGPAGTCGRAYCGAP